MRKNFLTLALAGLVFAACSDAGVVDPNVSANAPPDADMVRVQDGDGSVHFWLTVLHNNDGESGLLPENRAGIGEVGGAALFASVVEALREAAVERPFCAGNGRADGRSEAPECGVLMVSSGDNFLAGPVFAVSRDRGVPLFDGLALDLVGYDALAIGNHEFDFGPDVLADFIRSFPETEPPFLSANLDVSAEPELQALVSDGRIAPSTVVEVRGQEIGIVGATTDLLPVISSPRDVTVAAPAGAVQAAIDDLTDRGVDKILLISHLQSLNEDRELIPMLRGVDVAVAGGGDEMLANPFNRLLPGDEPVDRYPIFVTNADGDRVPVVTTVGDYRYVGELVVGFDRRGKVTAVPRRFVGPVRVAAADGFSPDPEVQSQVVDPVAAAVEGLKAEVLADQTVVLDARRGTVRTRESNAGDLVADALLWKARQIHADFGAPEPDVAIQNGGGIRGDKELPTGTFTKFESFELVPFPNFVTVMESISPSQLKDVLENAVSNVENVDGRFAQIAGFSFTWTRSNAAGSRVLEVTLDDGTDIVTGGSVVSGAPSVDVATIDFLATGGDGYDWGGASFTKLGTTYQEALEGFVTDPAQLDGLISAADYPTGGLGRITEN